MTSSGKLKTGGILIGIGLGGFVDGIVLHQILQWHHMLTSTGDHPATTVAGLEINTLWDGLFHASTWIATFIGLLLVWQATREKLLARSTSAFIGLLAMGWGLFNVVEGVVDHHILGIHHVHPSESLAWDLTFLAFGAALIAVGWLASRRGVASSRPAGMEGAN